MSAAIDVGTNDGLRHALRRIQAAASWEGPVGHALLSEIRRRAVRNAARVSSMTGAAADRGLVDDVVTTAWLVPHRNVDEVINAARPWAYLMYSAQRQVAADVKAQQLLTSTAKVRGRSRHLLPRRVRQIGATQAELVVALRHEPSGAGGAVRQVGHHDERPLVQVPAEPTERPPVEREPWCAEFIELLVDHGADKAVTISAVDRLSDLFTTTPGGMWEWEARRDPALARFGLTPGQCGALVALLAGSRKFRHDGREDSLISATRKALARGEQLKLTALQQRRVAAYVGRRREPSLWI